MKQIQNEVRMESNTVGVGGRTAAGEKAGTQTGVLGRTVDRLLANRQGRAVWGWCSETVSCQWLTSPTASCFCRLINNPCGSPFPHRSKISPHLCAEDTRVAWAFVYTCCMSETLHRATDLLRSSKAILSFPFKIDTISLQILKESV